MDNNVHILTATSSLHTFTNNVHSLHLHQHLHQQRPYAHCHFKSTHLLHASLVLPEHCRALLKGNTATYT